jgi:hypothetical protein
MTERPFKKSTFGVILGIVLALLFLAACGDGDESADPSTTTSESTTSQPSTSESTTSSTATSTSDTASSASTDPTGPTVMIYFSTGDGSDCGAVDSFVRTVTDDVDLYLSAFEELVSGPTAAELADGAGSFFSSATADTARSAVLTDGLLVVDFDDLRPLIPNASTSCGSEALLAQLNGTAFQFDGVERTRFLIEGSCGDFANWLQRECFETDRSGRQLDLPVVERADGSGCTPASVDTLPAGRWFGFIADVQPEELSFDLACWFTGSAAVEAAAEDGEESPPPNDYHIRNENDRVRVHPVDSATEVVWLPNPGDPATAETVSYDEWLTGRAARSYNPGVWLTVTDDSHVVRIEEQYVP